MRKIVIATIFISLSVIMVASTFWFENDMQRIENINKIHIRDIKKLQEVSHINKWIESHVVPIYRNIPKDSQKAQDLLVDFFDEYSQDLNLRIVKFIYKDNRSYNMDISFSVKKDDTHKLQELLHLKYKTGFIEFTKLRDEGEKIVGDFKLIQPYFGSKNALNK